MELTGKAKQQFERWYISHLHHAPHIVNFYGLPQSMQWGVYQEWADSMWYEIVIIPYGHEMCESFDCDKTFSASIHKDFQWQWDGCDYITRQQARDAAIAKLNEIINKQ